MIWQHTQPYKLGGNREIVAISTYSQKNREQSDIKQLIQGVHKVLIQFQNFYEVNS